MDIERGQVSANDMEVAYLSCGDGPLVLLLHGFPDCAWGWRHQLPALAQAGYRAVAPFMRGYAPTTLPPDGVYQTGALAADACALHEALDGDGDAVVIGHDWGALAAYGAAGLEPDRWRAVVGAAVPPGEVMSHAMLDYEQLRRSWYMFVLVHPLADLVVPADDLAFIDRLWADWSPGYAADHDLPAVKESLRDPAHLAAAIGYYRAALGDGPRSSHYDAAQGATRAVPDQPVLYLHGRDDGCIGAELVVGAVAAGATNTDSRTFTVDDAGHFLHLERPALVNGLVLDFLGSA